MRCLGCDAEIDDEEIMDIHEEETGHKFEDLSPEWTI
jgi:hypothetical protein